MAFSSTIDNRPHSIGDLVLLSGTFNAASVATGSIDLSAHLSEILSAQVNGDTFGDITGGGVDGAFGLITTATTLTIDCVASNTGKWTVIGRR
jgi:hypothetical protein